MDVVRETPEIDGWVDREHLLAYLFVFWKLEVIVVNNNLFIRIICVKMALQRKPIFLRKRLSTATDLELIY